MATIRDTTVCEGQGWKYPISEKLGWIAASSYPQLLARIRERCQSNAVPPPDEAVIQQWLCENLVIKCVEGGKLYANQYADRKNWPLLLRPMRLLATERDRGLGDIVARTIPEGDAFKAWFKQKFGYDCGCDQRQNWLNRNFPL